MKPLSLALLVVFAILALLSTGSFAFECPVSKCNPDIVPPVWYNTSKSATKIRGPQMTVYPVKPDGTAYSQAYAMFGLHELAESNATEAWPNPCLFQGFTWESAVSAGIISQALNVSEACCETSPVLRGTLPGGVERDYLQINVTRPDWPSFLLTVTINFAKEKVVIEKPALSNTDPYNITYNPGHPKVSMDIYNWPWLADVQPELGNTMLQFFFDNQVVLDEPGTIGWTDVKQHLNFFAHSKRVNLEYDYLKVTETDGVEYWSPVNSLTNFTLPGLVQEFGLQSKMVACDSSAKPIVPRYSHFFWDPSITALFVADPTAPTTPQTKKNNQTVGIAVGVSVGVVVVIVLVVVIVAIVLSKKNKQHFPRAGAD